MTAPLRRLLFGPFELDLGTYALLHAGEVQPLEPKVFETLAYLVQHPQRLVSREELRDEIWEGRHVANAAVSKAVREARRALGGSAQDQSWIKTVYGRGYIFQGEVQPQEVEGAGAAPPLPLTLPPDAQPDEASIAVLPFADMSPTRDQEYFCHGLAEEILNELSRIEGLKVAARTSSFRFRTTETDIRQIGEELGVRNLLDGSVRKSQDLLRISVQLISVESGFQLWSRRYDRSLEDVFAVQSEIARSIAETLRVELSPRAGATLFDQMTGNVEAFDLFLRGRRGLRLETRQGVEAAREAFAAATRADPKFAAAFAGWAIAAARLRYSWWINDDYTREAKEASTRALELAPDLAWGHQARGMVLWIEEDLEGAEKAFRKALRLDPTLYECYMSFGNLKMLIGQQEEAIRLFEEASRLRVDRFETFAHIGFAYLRLGREDLCVDYYRKAVHSAEQFLERSPANTRAWSVGACTLARLGEVEKCRAWAHQAERLAQGDSRTLYNCACALALIGDVEDSLRNLEASVAQGPMYRKWARWDLDLEALRGHPRFLELVE
jgi:TolB-like protein/Flp pilus assembly protein TadD